MSHFTQLQSGPILTWAPPQSPLRIEYSSGLLREVRIAAAGVDTFGLLFGVRHGRTIRLVATRRSAGLEPLGTFSSRASSDVFLTKEDLERFDSVPAHVALVVCGDHGGFFVRDAAGVIQAAHSYGEFSMAVPSPRSDRLARPMTVKKPRSYKTAVGTAACIALALAVILSMQFRRGDSEPPRALKVREEGGQLLVSWNAPARTTLTILDGGEQTSLAVAPDQSTLTYARRSGEVVVRVGAAQVRFIGRVPPPTGIARMRASLETLESRIACLRVAWVAKRNRLVALEELLQ